VEGRAGIEARNELAGEVCDAADEGGGTIIGLPSILIAIYGGRKVAVLIVRNCGTTDFFAKWTVAFWGPLAGPTTCQSG
jgi:hypothetical protein